MADLIITDLGSLNFRNDWNPKYQLQECYIQKFLTTDTIRMQYTVSKEIALNFRLTNNTTGESPAVTPVKVLELDDVETYDIVLSGLESGSYFLEIMSGVDVVTNTSFEVCEELENSILIQFTNYRNIQGTIFPQGDYFSFRVEGIFLPQEITHMVESNDFRDQNYDLHILSASPYRKETLTVGEKYGVPEWVADKLNRALSCSDVYIDGKPYVRSEGAAPSITVLNPGSPLFVYKIEVESSESGALSLDLQSNIGITAEVFNRLNASPVSNANVLVYMGDHLAVSMQTGTNGVASHRWTISKSEYDALAAGGTMRWVVSKDSFTSDTITMAIPSYQVAAQLGLKASATLINYRDIVRSTELTFPADPSGGNILLSPPSGMTLSVTKGPGSDWFASQRVGNLIVVLAPENPSTDSRAGSIIISSPLGGQLTIPVIQQGALGIKLTNIPIGYNMRGKTVILTNLHLMPQEFGYFLMELNGGGSFVEQDNQYIYFHDSGERMTIFEGMWNCTFFTFPNDEDYIVTSSDLPAGTVDVWGWDYAIAIDGPPPSLTLDEIPVGFNLRGKTIEFTNTDRRVPMPQSESESQSMILAAGTSDYMIALAWLAPGDYAILAASNSTGFDVLMRTQNDDPQQWTKTSITIPDDQDYIVTSNGLLAHVGDGWGFDYAIIT